jgi:hypothetical protein
MSAFSLAVLLALFVPSVQGSPSARSLAARAESARGSLQFTVGPSPACSDPRAAGECDFETHARLKVKSARHECRGRDVKISRLDPPANGFVVNTPGTSDRGVSTTTLGGRYTAFYPGYGGEFLNSAYEVTGGNRMSFRAVAARFKTFVASNPLRPLVCKRLRSSIEDVVAPTPLPPEF